MALRAQHLPITLQLPFAAARAEEGFLRLGDHQPADQRLRVNSRWIERDGRPWIPVMGEFHYSRCPASEWELELRKMAAGGVNIVASYVFWNHHEEIEGQYDWSACRDLRRFVALVHAVGLLFYLRPGPWVHAEARLGGFPDWLPQGGAVRCNDPRYLMHVQRFYNEIGAQLRDLMWRDGGPVIGAQLENEYDRVGPGCGAEHIARLKQLAIEAGLAVPLYTVTGWPTLDIPARDVIPVSGAYADGFWSGACGPLPPSGVFLFDTSRAIGEMGNVGGTPANEHIDKSHYPFFLAEAGGGMHVSYHRRPVVTADDVTATALVQIGSGANLYGYYMYHGGANPSARHGTLHETQASGYPNDVPVIGYDFRAPLGQYGQVRESYGRLRCLHQILAAFGADLAPMEAVLRDAAPNGPADASRLRVAARGDGTQAFLFVNNHLRHHALPDFDGVQFHLETGLGRMTVPHQPVTVPSGAHFIWPVGLRLGTARMSWATLQPLTRWKDGAHEVLVVFSHPGIAPTLCFDKAGVKAIDVPPEQLTTIDEGFLLTPPLGDAPLVFALTDALGVEHSIVLLPRALAEQALHTRVKGRDRLLLSPHLRYVQNDALVVSVPHDAGAAQVQVFPCDDLEGSQGDVPAPHFLSVDAGLPSVALPDIVVERLRDTAQAPLPRMGPFVAWRQRAVPTPPDDACYDTATRVRLHLPDAIPCDQGRVLLAIDYVGDTARLYADGAFVDDHFYDGETWWVGVDRFARDGRWPRLEVAIIAARDDLPIFLEAAARQRLRASAVPAAVTSVAVQWWRTRRIELPLAAA